MGGKEVDAEFVYGVNSEAQAISIHELGSTFGRKGLAWWGREHGLAATAIFRHHHNALAVARKMTYEERQNEQSWG